MPDFQPFKYYPDIALLDCAYTDEKIEEKTPVSYVVRTPTLEDHDRLMEAIEKYTDKRWLRGQKPTEFSRWAVYRNETCVKIESQRGIQFGREVFYKLEGYPIITVDEAIKKLKKEYMNLENLEIGTLLKNEAGFYRRVLSTPPSAEGELKTYLISVAITDKDSNELKKAGTPYTAYELKKCGYEVVDEDERTVDDVLNDLDDNDKEIVKNALNK